MRKWLALTCVVSILPGCYLGHSKPGKTLAYIANGTLIAAGIGVVATAPSASASDNIVTGVATGLDRDLHGVAGAGLLIAGVVGTLINLGTKTRSDAPAALPALTVAPQRVKLQIGHDLSPRSLSLVPSAP
jgi:hypothetical protein